MDQNVGIKFVWNYFSTISGAWKRSKYMHMKNYEINIRGNAEYCGETCNMYPKKHHVCYFLHPESCILHLTKGKL